jgi:cation transport ATPase
MKSLTISITWTCAVQIKSKIGVAIQLTSSNAMGVAGADVAIEAAHVALMRDDWRLAPQLLGLAQRTLGVVKPNLGFTAVYNLLGLSLAVFGFLPPALVAAAQSIPDLGILGNSSRLLKVRRDTYGASQIQFLPHLWYY